MHPRARDLRRQRAPRRKVYYQTLLYPTSGSSLEGGAGGRNGSLSRSSRYTRRRPPWAGCIPSSFALRGARGRARVHAGRQERAAGYTVQAPVGRHPFTLGGQGSPRPSLPPTQQLLLSHGPCAFRHVHRAHPAAQTSDRRRSDHTPCYAWRLSWWKI